MVAIEAPSTNFMHGTHLPEGVDLAGHNRSELAELHTWIPKERSAGQAAAAVRPIQQQLSNEAASKTKAALTVVTQLKIMSTVPAGHSKYLMAKGRPRTCMRRLQLP